MSRTVSRTTAWKSMYVVVVISPRTITRPVVVAVSQATRASGSWRMIASRIASLTWSQSLSGWPSVTDSEVNRYSAASTMLGMNPRDWVFGRAYHRASRARAMLPVLRHGSVGAPGGWGAWRLGDRR